MPTICKNQNNRKIFPIADKLLWSYKTSDQKLYFDMSKSMICNDLPQRIKVEVPELSQRASILDHKMRNNSWGFEEIK